MKANDWRMPNLGEKTEIMEQDDGGLVSRVTTDSGDISLTRYRVFPGIDLIYNDVHMSRNIVGAMYEKRNMIEIDHCREGRLECQVGKDYFYLAPGDISIHRLGDFVREEVFPTSHYHGITIQIDLQNSPRCLASFLEDVDVEPEQIVKKFRLDEQNYFALRQMPPIEHIFSELYSLPESVKKGYLKVKILELFLFLSGLEQEENRLEQRHLSETQVVLAKKVCTYLTEHMDEHFTLSQLSEQYRVSVSQIKSSFAGVYGISVQAYIRGQRMRAAAECLRKTDDSVLEIAGKYGYCNASKFAAAFRAVMGVTPMQFRKGIYHKES